MRELMSRANQEYTEILWQDLDGDSQVALGKQYPDISSFPFVIIDGEYVGGLVPVAKKFLADGLVTAPQKK